MRVVNIMNFVRAVEPRAVIDLMEPVVEEIKLNKKYGFENTFLLQYDTMLSEEFVNLFKKEKDEKMELGIWIEMAKPLVEKIGVEWRGRKDWTWDYHVNPGFLPAYTKEQKEKIIDEIMHKFKSLFGYYPKTAGSWVLDSYSVDYMTEKYKLDAFCICREQWGTDGYTFWGGYYNGPYFPSKNNILHPAQTNEMQIKSPVIRILGPDPIYCYHERFKETYNKMKYTLYTLEPTWQCGQSEEWVEWYFRNFTENENLGYSYVQTGQENPFGWKNIKKGLPMQLELISTLEKQGKIKVEKVCDTGRRFKETYNETPPTAYSALDDWANMGNKSVWYNCKNYRINIFNDDELVAIRDIHKFDENYVDQYLENPCKEAVCIYDALPVIDAVRFSDEKVKSGIYFGRGCIEKIEKQNQNDLAVYINADDKKIRLLLSEEQILVESDCDFAAEVKYGSEASDAIDINENQIKFIHNGMKYRMVLQTGKFVGSKMVSDCGKILIKLD